MAVQDNEVDVKIGATTDKLDAGIAQARSKIQGLQNEVGGLAAGFRGLAQGIAGAFSIAGFASFVSGMAKLGEDTERMGAILGQTSEQIGTMAGVAKVSGTSLESMATSIERISLNVQRSTQDAFNPAAQALHALGLNARDIIGLPTDKYFETLADAVSKYRGSLNLTNIVQAIGGRGVAQMIPQLLEGGEGFRKLAEEVRKTGTVMTEVQTTAFGKTDDAIDLLGLSLKGVGITLFDMMNPALKALIDYMKDVVQWFNNAMKDGGALARTFDFLGTVAKMVASAIAGIIATIQGLTLALGLAFEAIHNGFSGVRTDTEKFAKDFEQIGGRLKETLRGIWNPQITIGKGAGEGKDAPGMNFGGKNALDAQMKSIEGQIQAIEAGTARAKLVYANDAENFKTTQDRKFALMQQSVQRQEAAEIAVYQRALQLGGLSLAQRQEYENKIVQLRSRTDLELIRLDQEAVQNMKAVFMTGFDAIQSSFNGQLRGLLSGTTTWAQAFKTIMGDLIIFAIQQFEKMGFEWLATQLGMTAASTTGSAARAAAEVAGGEAALPIKIAAFTSDIMARSALTFAGIFANMSPLLGPAAAGPAAAGQASVLAQLANVPKLDVGMWNVPGDMFAQIHKGEMVVPADAAEGMRGGGGGASIAIHAWDGASVESWLRRGGATQLAGAISKAQNLQRSTRGKF